MAARKRVVLPPGVPQPVSTPHDAPSPPTQGWWIDPCQPPRGFTQRYHDGSNWTGYVSELLGSRWREVTERPYSQPPQDSKYALLPPPAPIPLYPPEPTTKGWWTDPYRPGPDPANPAKPAPGPLCQRFHDGERWTPYICYRIPGARPRKWSLALPGPNFWGGITQDGDPLGHPAPKLGVRTIDDYSFLPMALSGSEPPDPPTMGWWRDPLSDFGERFHDGSRWTQYRAYWSRQWGREVLESPPVPRHSPPAVEYNPGPLRTERSFAVAMVALLGGFAVLGLSAAFDRGSGPSAWTARAGLLAFVAGFGALLVHVARTLFPPKSLGRTDSSNFFYGGILLLLSGAGVVALKDQVLRALWLR